MPVPPPGVGNENFILYLSLYNSLLPPLESHTVMSKEFMSVCVGEKGWEM